MKTDNSLPRHFSLSKQICLCLYTSMIFQFKKEKVYCTKMLDIIITYYTFYIGYIGFFIHALVIAV